MAILSDFLNQIMGNVPQNQNVILKALDPRQDVKGNENMSLGGFASNLAKGAGNLVGGLAQGVVRAGSDVLHPDQIAPDVTNLVKGIGSSVNDTLGQPINPQSGSLQMPSVGEAGMHAYNDPLGTFLTAQGIGNVASAVKGKIAPTEESLPATPPDLGKATKMGNKVLQGQYKTVTNPTDVNTIANYGLTKPEDIANAAQKITGENGVVTKMTREAVSKAAPVDLTGVSNTASRLLNDGNFIPETASKKLYNQISQFADDQGVSSRGEEVPRTPIVNKNPLDTFEFIQGLEKKASQYYSSKSLDPGVRELANVYSSMADELKNKLFTDSGADQQVPGVLTPENKAVLDSVDPSGRLSANIMGSQTIRDLRGAVSPFVRLSQAAIKTAEKAAGEPMNPASAIDLASSVVSGNPLGAGLFAAGTNAGKNLIGNTLRTVGNIPKVGLPAEVLPLGLGAMGETVPNSPQQQPSGDNTQHATQYSIPNPYTDLKGPDGPLALAPGDPQTLAKGAELDAMSKDPVTQSNPTTRAEYLRQVSLYNSQKALGEKIQPYYQKATQADGYFKQVYNDLQQAAPDLRNSNLTLDKIRNSTDPKYAALVTDLTNLDDLLYGGKDVLFGAWTPDVAMSKVNAANKQVVDGLTSYVKSLTSQNEPMSAAPTSLPATPQAFPQTQNAPLPPIGNGTNVQAMPPMQGIIQPLQ